MWTYLPVVGVCQQLRVRCFHRLFVRAQFAHRLFQGRGVVFELLEFVPHGGQPLRQLLVLVTQMGVALSHQVQLGHFGHQPGKLFFAAHGHAFVQLPLQLGPRLVQTLLRRRQRRGESGTFRLSNRQFGLQKIFFSLHVPHD